MKYLKKTLIATGVLGLMASTALASTTLRVQTHYGETSPMGELYKELANNVEIMTGGDVKMEMFYSSSVVKSTETFDAAVNGVLDCDMTGAGYITGKNPAFQFVGDIMGGYYRADQQLGWFYYGGGKDAAQDLYDKYNMKLVGVWTPSQESLSSSRPIAGISDLKDWKFRSPPGMESRIFEKLGAKPIVMDFSEVFTGLETKMIDGADASQLAVNDSLGIYDLVKYATYPGFHSMPTEHLACNQDVWDTLSAKDQLIIEEAVKAMGLKVILAFAKVNNEVADKLRKNGVTLYTWSEEDLGEFRRVAVETWDEFATTPEAKALVENHKAHLKKIGAIDD